MTADLTDQVRRWLAAEGRDEQAADTAFRELFRAVPRLSPPPAFIDSVLAALATRRRTTRWRWWEARWMRPLTAAGLTMVGLAILGVLSSMPVPAVSSVVRAWSLAFADGVRALTRALDLGLWVWAVLAAVGSAARAVVATPWVSVALAVNGIVGLVGFLGLRRLLGPREEVMSW